MGENFWNVKILNFFSSEKKFLHHKSNSLSPKLKLSNRDVDLIETFFATGKDCMRWFGRGARGPNFFQKVGKIDDFQISLKGFAYLKK